MTSGRIRIGVAGWDYPDWAGVVYPAGGRRLDRLAYIAQYVDLVEVNSTFYRPNPPPMAESWLRRTADRPDFRFAAKSHRLWTHGPEEELDRAIPPTLQGLAPLRDAGRLSALLVQFPQSFHHEARALDRLARIAGHAAGWPLVVEVRHASWDDDRAERWFRGRGLGWCVVDQPRVGRSTAPPRARVTSRVAYLRLHGRNRADWFREGAGRDARYDYLYAQSELGPLAGSARAMADAAEELVVVQNNHFRGQALANALQMRHLIEGTRPPAPGHLVDAYPELESSVEIRREGLF